MTPACPVVLWVDSSDWFVYHARPVISHLFPVLPVDAVLLLKGVNFLFTQTEELFIGVHRRVRLVHRVIPLHEFFQFLVEFSKVMLLHFFLMSKHRYVSLTECDSENSFAYTGIFVDRFHNLIHFISS